MLQVPRGYPGEIQDRWFDTARAARHALSSTDAVSTGQGEPACAKCRWAARGEEKSFPGERVSKTPAGRSELSCCAGPLPGERVSNPVPPCADCRPRFGVRRGARGTGGRRDLACNTCREHECRLVALRRRWPSSEANAAADHEPLWWRVRAPGGGAAADREPFWWRIRSRDRGAAAGRQSLCSELRVFRGSGRHQAPLFDEGDQQRGRRGAAERRGRAS